MPKVGTLPGIEALIISIAIAGVCGFAAVDRCIPSDWKQPTRPFEELKAELGDRVSLLRGVIIAVIALGALASTLGFMAAARSIWHPPPDAMFVLRPPGVMFVGPGFLIGIALAGLFEAHIDRRIMKDRYWDAWYVARGRRYVNPPRPTERQFLRGRRATTIMVPLFATVGLIASCLALDSWGYVTPTEIAANRFLSFREVHHAFSDVTSIRTYLTGKHHNYLACRIRFNDGSSFSNQDPPSNLTNAETEALAAYVFERTSVPWTRDR